MFRVGIIGCGTIAPMHANALASNDQTIFAACADVNFDRATTFAAQYGCKAYASAEEMLAAEVLDAVHICTPHATHFPLIQLAAQKGLVVFTEKPPTTTRADFAQLHLSEPVEVEDTLHALLRYDDGKCSEGW